MFQFVCTMLCFCPSYNMVLLLGAKHLHHMLIQSSDYRKKAVRTFSFKPRMSPSLAIFNDCKLLKLSETFELRLLTFVFDSVNKSLPSCYHDFFLFCSSVHQYSTRQASQGDINILKKQPSTWWKVYSIS